MLANPTTSLAKRHRLARLSFRNDAQSIDIGTSLCLSLVIRYLVVPVRRVILTRAALEWPSLAIHTSRASLLGILKGGEEQEQSGKLASLVCSVDTAGRYDECTICSLCSQPMPKPKR